MGKLLNIDILIFMYTFFYVVYCILIFMYQVRVCDFIPEFRGNIQQYIQHVDMARWQDEQFRICWDTFPLGTITSRNNTISG